MNTQDINNQGNYVLGLDVSTKTIGISLFEDMGEYGDLKVLTHIAPKVSPDPNNKMQELFEKARIFENDFLNKYTQINIKRVIIEEPLLQSNNVYTIATLLRFNGMIARSIYEILGITPDFISSYDARKYAFPQLMGVRTVKRSGEVKTDKEVKSAKPTLFGAYDSNIDKKMVIWDFVSELEPQIVWLYDKKNKLKKENFDLSDAYTCVLGWMKKNNLWK
jgi:hypothetical protein